MLKSKKMIICLVIISIMARSFASTAFAESCYTYWLVHTNQSVYDL
jgi:hypothetical protein